MRIGSTRLEGPWGHAALLVGFLAFTIWYLQDAVRASSNVQNLLLIGPASAVALAVGLLLLVRDARHLRLVPAAGAGPDPRPFRERHGPVAAMAALVAYALAMPYAGFDVATFVFIAVGMLIQGERRPLVLIGFPAIVTAGVIYALKTILFVPVPTLLLG